DLVPPTDRGGCKETGFVLESHSEFELVEQRILGIEFSWGWWRARDPAEQRVFDRRVGKPVVKPHLESLAQALAQPRDQSPFIVVKVVAEIARGNLDGFSRPALGQISTRCDVRCGPGVVKFKQGVRLAAPVFLECDTCRVELLGGNESDTALGYQAAERVEEAANLGWLKAEALFVGEARGSGGIPGSRRKAVGAKPAHGGFRRTSRPPPRPPSARR